MICPECNFEYRDGIDVCPECNCPLVETLPTEDVVYRDAIPVFLCEAANDFEADVIISKLDSEGVFAFKKYQGSDGYNKIMLGITVLGVQIFVSEDDLEKAKEILDI